MVQVAVFGALFALPTSLVLAAGEGGNGFQRGDNRMMPQTVDGCVQRTGKTTAECELLVSRLKDFKERKSSEQGWKPEQKDTRMRQGADMGDRGERRGMMDEAGRPGRFGLHSADRFEAMKTRITKMVDFLKAKGINTSELESNFSALKDKMVTAQSDFAKFEAARTAWKADKSAANKTALDVARGTAKESMTAVRTYYHDTLLPLLKTLLQSVV